jgi:hypothetical protein
MKRKIFYYIGVIITIISALFFYAEVSFYGFEYTIAFIGIVLWAYNAKDRKSSTEE